MVRVTQPKATRKKRKKTLKAAKGYKWGRKNKYKAAKEAVAHALVNQYIDRKKRKRDFRRLWQIKINAACRENGISYSKFVDLLKKNNIELDRKILANLAENEPETFKKIIEECKQ